MIGHLAQAIDEAIPEGATGMAAAEAVVKFMEERGYRIVTKEQAAATYGQSVVDAKNST